MFDRGNEASGKAALPLARRASIRGLRPGCNLGSMPMAANSPVEPPRDPAASGIAVPTPSLTRSQKIALTIAIAVGALVWLLESFAAHLAVGDAAREVINLEVASQVSALAGVLLGILVVPQLRDPKWTFVLAALALSLGAAAHGRGASSQPIRSPTRWP
jgi:hypothetical protein